MDTEEPYFEKKILVLALLPLRNLPPEMAGKILIEYLNSLETGKIEEELEPMILTMLKYISITNTI